MSDEKDDYLDEIYKNLDYKPGELRHVPPRPRFTEVRHGALVFGPGSGGGQIHPGLELDKILPFLVPAGDTREELVQPQCLFRGDTLYVVSDQIKTLELVSVRVGNVSCVLSPEPTRVLLNGGHMFALEMPTCHVGQRIAIRLHNRPNPGAVGATVRCWLVGRFIQ